MILVVGSTSTATANFSMLNNLGSSVLFTGQDLTHRVYHTSIADCQNLKNHLIKFKKIYWAKSSPNEFTNFSDYFETIFLLKSFFQMNWRWN